MKNPNGYGSVAKLSGNRRRPYVVRKTRGWDARGYPIYATIGYYATREEAMIALAEYNRRPYDIDAAKITLKDLYDRWYERKMPKLGDSLQNNLRAAFKHCVPLYHMRYRDIRSYHMQDIIDHCGCGYSTQGTIKNLFGHLDRFAMELDVIQKMYSSLLVSQPIPETSKTPYTDEEVDALWSIQEQEWVDTILIMLYGGWRIGELLTIKTADVDLEQGIIRGGIKTRSGKNRIVPIHSRIMPFIRDRMSTEREYLISAHSKAPVSDSQYRERFNAIMRALNMKHTPHECRHTFRSRLDSAGANKTCIDLMMGHKSKEVGERVYTHKTIQELKEAIELITR